MRSLALRVRSVGIPTWLWSLSLITILVVIGLELDEFSKLLLGEMLIAGLFAMSLNLILGYGGMVHFGHAAFYGIGGYTLAILSQKYNVSISAAMIAAPILSAVLAVIIGWFCVRRVRLYFAILTLAFGQLVCILIFQARDFTGGDDGLQGLLRPEFLLDPNSFYLFTLLVFVACFFALRTLINAPFVLTLRTIRENPERAVFICVDVRRHQLITFVIGAFFAGIAGMLFALHNRFVAPDMLYWTTSSQPILGSLLGGMFSLTGPAIGGALLGILRGAINHVTQFLPLVLGLLTVGLGLIAPEGLVGLGRQLTRGAHK